MTPDPEPRIVYHDGEPHELATAPPQEDLGPLPDLALAPVPREEWRDVELWATEPDGPRSRVRTFDEMAAALLNDRPVVLHLEIGAGFLQPGPGGLIEPGGRVLGWQRLLACGLRRLEDGRWAVRVRNTWGNTWGGAGDGLLHEGHFQPGDFHAFAIEAPAAP